MQESLVDYYDTFAENRFDVGYNTEKTMKLTPAQGLPVYFRNPNKPIHLRDEILVELALMQSQTLNIKALSFQKGNRQGNCGY